MTNLKILYLEGNEVCKKIKNYRKTLIAALPNLKHLDDRIIFPEDRLYAEVLLYKRHLLKEVLLQNEKQEKNFKKKKS